MEQQGKLEDVGKAARNRKIERKQDSEGDR